MTASSTPSTSAELPRGRPPGLPPESSPQSATGDPGSSAQLLSRITAQLSTQLFRLGGRGPRHPPEDRPSHPPTLVAVAHGSRDPRALPTVTALLDLVRALRPGLPVRLGHLELNAPLLPETLATLRGEAVLVPLLFGRGHHVKQDIPQALAAAPGLRARAAAPLGPHPLLAEVLHARLAEAGWDAPASRAAAARHAVVLAGAGSRDPGSAADAARTAELLSARLGGIRVVPAYASAAAPSVPGALAALLAGGRDRIAVASYFVAPGWFAARTAAQAPGIAAAPLGAHPALARLLLHRYDEALAHSPVTAPAPVTASA